MIQQFYLVFTLLVTTQLLSCVQVQSPPQNKETQLAISGVWDIPTNFALGSTFALSPKHLKETSVKEEKIQQIYRNYGSRIVKNLHQHGYRLANHGEKPDFYVGFGLALADDLSDVTINEKLGVTPGLTEDRDLEKGSLLLYVEDGASSERIWRAAVQGFVQHDIDQQEQLQRIDRIVAMGLSHFYSPH